MEFQSLFEKYHDTFGEWFPTMCFQADTEQEMAERINKCLEVSKPAEEVFNIDYGNDILY